MESDATSFLRKKLSTISEYALCKPPGHLGNEALSGQGGRNYWLSCNPSGGLNSSR